MKGKYMWFRMLPLAVGGASMAMGSTGLSAADNTGAAQASAIEEIVVTARRTEERQQDVPIAVTALSGDALAARGITDISDLNKTIPGLSALPANSPATLILNLRGLGNQNPNGGPDAAVGFYVNDVPINMQIGTNLGMYDLENVQVLKGPQGTLFGRNSTGGAILVNSAKPTDRFEGHVQVGGTFFEIGNGWQSEVVLNLPVNEHLAVRFAASTENRDGWIKNVINPSAGPAVFNYPYAFGKTHFDKLGSVDSQDYRGSVLWKITPTLQNLTVYENGMFHGDSLVNRPEDLNPAGPIATLQPILFPGAPNPAVALQQVKAAQSNYWWSTAVPSENPLSVNTETLSNSTTWNINDDLTLKNIVGWRWVNELYSQDIVGLPGPYFDYAQQDGGTNRSDEMQLQGKALDANLNWVAGLFYFEESFSNHSNRFVQFGFAGEDNTFKSKSTSGSVFAQGTYKIPSIQGLSVTVGGRYTRDRKSATDTRYVAPGVCLYGPGVCTVSGSGSWQQPTYTLSLDYKWDRDSMVYVTTRSGYRAGGFSQTAGNATAFKPFEPEKVTDYEIGLKKDWSLRDMPLRTNMALFWQDYKNIQRLVVDPVDVTAQYIRNAAVATVKGAEIELTWQLTRALQIEYSFAYVNPRYKKFIDNGVNYAGATFAFAPHSTHNLSASYAFPETPSFGKITARAQYHRQSEMFLDDEKQTTAFGPADTLTTRAYGLLDLGLDVKSIMGSKMDLNLFVKNAGDTKVTTSGAPLYNSIGMGMRFFTVPPRMFGFNLKYNFGY